MHTNIIHHYEYNVRPGGVVHKGSLGQERRGRVLLHGEGEPLLLAHLVPLALEKQQSGNRTKFE